MSDKFISPDILKQILTKIKSKIPTKISQLVNDTGLVTLNTLEVTPVVTTGTEIAEINGTKIYAPEAKVEAIKTSGTHIATVNGVKLYARTKKTQTVEYSFTMDSQFGTYEKSKSISLSGGKAISCAYSRHVWDYVDSGDKWGFEFYGCSLSNIGNGTATLNCDYTVGPQEVIQHHFQKGRIFINVTWEVYS